MREVYPLGRRAAAPSVTSRFVSSANRRTPIRLVSPLTTRYGAGLMNTVRTLSHPVSASVPQAGLFETAEQPALTLFAIGLIGFGIIGLVTHDFGMVWQPVAPWFPARTALAWITAAFELATGVGLLFRPTSAVAARIMLPGLALWMLLKLPSLFVAPQIEAVWLGFGELAMLFAGGLALFAQLAGIPETSSPLAFLSGQRGLRFARIFFGLWVIPVGLSHFFYTQATVNLIPKWIPVPVFFAYLTGAGHIASGLASLTGVWRRVALWAETAMIGVLAFVVWLPRIFAAPATRLPWTAFFITWVIGAAVSALATTEAKND